MYLGMLWYSEKIYNTHSSVGALAVALMIM